MRVVVLVAVLLAMPDGRAALLVVQPPDGGKPTLRSALDEALVVVGSVATLLRVRHRFSPFSIGVHRSAALILPHSRQSRNTPPSPSPVVVVMVVVRPRPRPRPCCVYSITPNPLTPNR